MTLRSSSLPSEDAVSAAPDHHKVLFENDFVRVLRTTLAAGDRTPLHCHPWPMTLYFQKWSDIVQYDANGGVTIDTRQIETKPSSGSAVWCPAVPLHFTENVGEDDLVVIAVELKED